MTALLIIVASMLPFAFALGWIMRDQPTKPKLTPLQKQLTFAMMREHRHRTAEFADWMFQSGVWFAQRKN